MPPRSLLDTDLYKFTMQQAVLRYFPETRAVYKFTNRDQDTLFSKTCVENLIHAVSGFSDLKLSDSEFEWLQATCTYLQPSYLQYLRSFRFKQEQVTVQFKPSGGGDMGEVTITIAGPWVEAILWEVPLMAMLSEAFFTTVDTDWSLQGQADTAYHKARTLLLAGLNFSEFGTRRRRSFETQDIVVEALCRASQDNLGPGRLTGTSNVHLAHKHALSPIGTVAHEWFMGVAALTGYENANSRALDMWEGLYSDSVLLALTDTFSTEVFLKEFAADRERVSRWHGLRQDSGNPFTFAERAREVYERIGVNHREKVIIYSDALTVEKAIQLKEATDQVGFKCSFGIGTNFTNDFRTLSSAGQQKSKPLNIVIKLHEVDGKPCIKISDDLTKNTGDRETVKKVKELYGVPTRD